MTTQQSGLQRYRRYYKQLEEAAGAQKTRAYSTAIFSFLAAALFGLYAILPTMRTILFLRKEIVDKTTVNKQMEDKITALIESQAAYEDASDNILLVSEAIPQTANAINLASSLKNLTSRVGASTSSIQISQVPLLNAEATTGAKQANMPSTFSLTVTASSTYSSLKDFIEGLLTLSRIVTIESMKFTRTSGLTSNTTGSALQLVLQLQSYWQQL